MKIEVIGSGCAKCKKLFELTKEIVQELGIGDEVFYSTDVNKIVALGIMQSPIVTVDDQPVLIGILPEKEKLKEIIFKNQILKEKGSGGCSCGGKC
jgi:small redox-active disulfide protein 2